MASATVEEHSQIEYHLRQAFLQAENASTKYHIRKASAMLGKQGVLISD